LVTDFATVGILAAAAVVAVLSLIVFAFSSAALSSFLNLDPTKISPFEEADEPKNYRIVRALLRKASHTAVALSSLGYLSFSIALLLVFLIIYHTTGIEMLPLWGEALAGAAIFLVLGFIFIYVGHTLPLMQLSSEDYVIKNSSLVRFAYGAMYPAAALLVRLASAAGRSDAIAEAMKLEDFDVYEETAPVEDELEEEEREMISAIVEMGETTVREIMTPRIDIIALDADDPAQESINAILNSTYSRFPVYEGTIDNIIGVLHIRDLTVELNTKRPEEINIRQLAQETLYIPETKRIDELLQDLRREKKHLVVVSDEYGGTAGIVTIEDVLEEIVGEIQDEFDDEAQGVYRKDDGSFVINPSLSIEEVNEELGTELDAEGSDTLGGLLLAKFGRIPRQGDIIHIDGVRFTILSVVKNRIKLVRAEIRR
jgi:putative hemolysin